MSINSSKNNRFTMDRLQKYKNKPLYEVPEHYFEQLQHEVMQRVNKEVIRQKNTKRWISVASIAASFTIILTLSYFIFVNRDTNEHFYVHEDIFQPENTILTSDSNYLAESKELVLEKNIITEEIPKLISPNVPFVAETIVYRAVDYYLDDYDISNFCEVMCDLECFYDY
jgi:hypothetical protein